MKIRRVRITFVEIAQVQPVAPYRSRLRTSSTTRSAIVRLDTQDGLTGWGEYNINFLPDVDVQRLESSAASWLIGCDPWQLERFHATCPLETRLKSGVEMAIWDLRGKAVGLPVAELLGGRLREQIELAACMGIASYERAGELAGYYVEQGYSTLKMKAGAAIDEDVAMVEGIRDAVGDRLKLRVDPNCAYSREQALELARRLEPLALEYLEQPTAAERIDEAAWLRRNTSTPVALNESVADPASAMAILQADAAAVLLPDTPQAGGILPCVKIGHLAEASDTPCVMHCGHDLGLKTAAMLHVASATPAFRLANDSTYYGLADDILAEPLPISAGRMTVPAGPGLGVAVDEEKLRRYSVAAPVPGADTRGR